MSDSKEANPKTKGQFLVYSPVVKDSLTTAIDGKNYQTKFYNLDAIISVGGIIIAQKRPSPTHKESLTVRERRLVRDLEQTIAKNVAEILGN